METIRYNNVIIRNVSHPNVSPAYPSDWPKLRVRVYRRDDYQCQSCGAEGGNKSDNELHAHHIVPISDDGTHNISNLLTLCKECHSKVHEVLSSQTYDRVSNTTCVEDLPPVSDKCQNCHVENEEKEDHEFHSHIILPVSDGGKHSKSNVATLCKDCHRCIHQNISKDQIATDKKVSATLCVDCGGNAPSVNEERCYQCRQKSHTPNVEDTKNFSSKTLDEHDNNHSATSNFLTVLYIIVPGAAIFLLLITLFYILYSI
jgi:5-methylcytosine-specific restriction endonuclease McrA